MRVAILLYDRFTALDAIGPYEVLALVPGVEIRFVGVARGPIRTDNGALSVTIEHAIGDLPDPEIVLVPGGAGKRAVMADEAALDWLRAAHATSRFTTSVCTGALILGAAGILDGVRATTHWCHREELAALGADVVPDRVVEEGRIVTAAGVSAGIDMALRLAGRIAGDDVAMAVQLGIEYDPRPPYDCGSPEAAPPAIAAAVRRVELGARPASA